MSSYKRDITIGVGISTVVNIVLNATLVPFLGINGVSIATSISMIIWNVILGIMVYKRLGTDPTILGLGN